MSEKFRRFSMTQLHYATIQAVYPQNKLKMFYHLQIPNLRWCKIWWINWSYFFHCTGKYPNVDQPVLVPQSPMRTSSIAYYKVINWLINIAGGTRHVHDLRLKLWLKSTQLGLIAQASLGTKYTHAYAYTALESLQSATYILGQLDSYLLLNWPNSF